VIPARAIGFALATAGSLLLLAIFAALLRFQALFAVGLTMKAMAKAGLLGALGLVLLATGLRMLSNSRIS
jgi:hypothetical protein